MSRPLELYGGGDLSRSLGLIGRGDLSLGLYGGDLSRSLGLYGGDRSRSLGLIGRGDRSLGLYGGGDLSKRESLLRDIRIGDRILSRDRGGDDFLLSLSERFLGDLSRGDGDL